MIRNKFGALLLGLSMVLGLGVTAAVVAAPASASSTQTQSRNCWGYTYYGSVTYTRSGANITINSYSISGPNLVEWRARWFATAGNVIEDSTYHAADPSPINRSPNWSRYMSGTNQVLLNAGKYDDGHASCEMWFSIPAG